MIDLHAHVLPGVDDGARDWEEAVEMCRRARAHGTNGLVATPHFFREVFPTPEVGTVHTLLLRLQGLLDSKEGARVQLYLGGDCHLHADIIRNVVDGRVPTINGSRYLLLELPTDSLPPALNELLFNMSMRHITPIITHPERNAVFSRHPGTLYDLIKGGAFAQITASSLTGFFGSSVRRTAEMMVSKGLVQMMASDAHDPEHRAPILSGGLEVARKIIGDRLAEKMVDDVPRAILEDHPIQYPSPVRPKKEGKWRLNRVFAR